MQAKRGAKNNHAQGCQNGKLNIFLPISIDIKLISFSKSYRLDETFEKIKHGLTVLK